MTTVQGWLKSTRSSYVNTGSFPRNHIWMYGVLKKSIIAYLKFHICIPKISASPCVSSDQKNQNIRHSWIRLWIRTRALSQTNTGVNFRILPKIFYQNICLIVPCCNTCKDPNGLLHPEWPEIPYMNTWNLLNAYQELNFFIFKCVVSHIIMDF